MTKKQIYLDTSAYLAVLLRGKHSEKISALLSDARVYSSVFLILEAERAIVRLSREKLLGVADASEVLAQITKDLEGFALQPVTLELCASGSFPILHTPRSGDLIHLRTAKWFATNTGLDLFVTLDKKQRDAAREMDLPILEL